MELLSVDAYKFHFHTSNNGQSPAQDVLTGGGTHAVPRVHANGNGQFSMLISVDDRFGLTTSFSRSVFLHNFFHEVNAETMDRFVRFFCLF
jgi:hypothetical protein